MLTLSPLHSCSQIISTGIKEIGPYYWVGKYNNGVDYYAGQTFKIPVNGIIKTIKLFSSLVFQKPVATLSVYSFDPVNFRWVNKKSELSISLTKSQENQWINFDIPVVSVQKDESFGFKLTCKEGGMLAIAECPWNISNPYKDGMEWVGSSYREEGRFQTEFDFAFEVDIEPLPNAKFL